MNDELKKLTTNDLAKLITNDPSMLTKLSQEQLVEISSQLNPYAKSISSDSGKPYLFSFVNFKMNYLKTKQSISVSMFLEQMIQESEHWVDQTNLPVEEYDSFKRHLDVFRKFFLTFDSDVHSQQSVHKETLKSTELPSLDFIAKWQRYEEQNEEKLTQIMKDHYYYNPKYQCAIQVYDIFDNTKKAKDYVDQNALTIGVDITQANTGQWVVLQDDEQTLEQTHYVGDDNAYVTGLIGQMKKEAKIGETMLKKRVNKKKEQYPEAFNKEAGNILNNMQSVNQDYKSQRLLLAGTDDTDLNDHDIVNELADSIPVLLNQAGLSLSKLDI